MGNRIHMLPLLPSSTYTRNRKFVTEEWNALFGPNSTLPVDKVASGWRGVLYANLAIIDPVASWNFFAQPNFDYGLLDQGATRTWYLAFAAGKLQQQPHGRYSSDMADSVL